MDSLQNYITDSEEEEGEEESSTEENTDQRNDNKGGATQPGRQTKPEKKETNFDFFGLDNSDVNDEEYRPEVKKPKVTGFVTEQGESVSLPQSDFWENFTVDQARDCVRKEDGSLANVAEIQPLKHATSSSKMENHHHSAISHTNRMQNQKEVQQLKDTGWSVRNKASSFEESKKNIIPNTQKEKRQYFYVHSKIAPFLSRKSVRSAPASRRETLLSSAHAGVVNRVCWNMASYSHLFLSVSMDRTIKVWNVWSQLDPCLTTLSVHDKAVRDGVWSHDGRRILSCSYDRSAVVTDVETGKALNRFHHDSHVTSCKFHPSNCNLFISGCQNMILSWDVRSPSNPCQKYRYKDRIGQVQDLLFNTDGDTFFSACDELSQDSADRNIMCWDFKSGVVLSNQIYQERYSCTRLKLHPTESHFLAQSHGNYIAIFSLNRPYKMTKAKRFEGHKLAGYSIGFDLTPDGASVVSGDAFGKVYVYNYNTGRNHKMLRTDIDVCMDVSCHPLLPSTFVCCGWDGSIEVWH